MSLKENILFYTGVVVTGAAAGAYVCMDGNWLRGMQYGAAATTAVVCSYLATSMLYHIALEALKISFAIAVPAAIALTFMPQKWCDVIKTVTCDKFVEAVAPYGVNITSLENFLCAR